MSTTTHRSDPTPTRRATYQDVLDPPAHRVAEIVDGTLYTRPRPETLPARIPRSHCAYNARYDHDANGLTCEPGRDHPVP